MLAVKHGAGYVIACEMFEAMAEVAREVIAANGLSDQILVVTAKSSEIDSLPFAPDILISELLDSALLGEGELVWDVHPPYCIVPWSSTTIHNINAVAVKGHPLCAVLFCAVLCCAVLCVVHFVTLILCAL